SQTRAHGTGGTLHFILNNQIGSTVSHPRDARSSRYCADVARAIDAPVLHVNADDPDAVVTVARLATEYRMTFGADVIVDHVGYRRHGHFGSDDPTVTQPAVQRRIRSHPSATVIYAEKLAARGVGLHDEVERLKAEVLAPRPAGEPGSSNAPESNRAAHGDDSLPEALATSSVTTAVPLAQLQVLVRRLTTVPSHFVLHSDIQKILER